MSTAQRFGTLLLSVLGAWAPASGLGQEYTLSLKVKGQQIEGMPLSWDSASVRLLGRDGTLWQFPPSAATEYRQVADNFQGFSAGELRSQLIHEFGKSYDVSGTGSYLVVHPIGQRGIWPQRFDEMYREMVVYFTARRIEVSKPKFPLVAVVLPSQAEFIEYASKAGIGNLSKNVQGLYHLVSNRVLVFDTGSGGAAGEPDFSTVIHETAHQTAYNTGVHSRFGNTPVWVVEGIGTMFEAPGVHNSRQYRQVSDRINVYRRTEFLKLLDNRPNNLLSQLIGSDKIFQLDWRAAYANAWALTFYLSERETTKYAEYLQKTAQRPPFTPYSATDRLKDFTDTFRPELQMLDLRMVRFIKSLEP